jgi:hypothetical protein
VLYCLRLLIVVLRVGEGERAKRLFLQQLPVLFLWLPAGPAACLTP